MIRRTLTGEGHMSDAVIHTRVSTLPPDLRTEVQAIRGDEAGGRWISATEGLVPVFAWVGALVVIVPWVAYRVHKFTTQAPWVREGGVKALLAVVALFVAWTALYTTVDTVRAVGRNGWGVTSVGLVRRVGDRLTVWPWERVVAVSLEEGRTPAVVYDPATGRMKVAVTETERMARHVSGLPQYQELGPGTSGATWMHVQVDEGPGASVFIPAGKRHRVAAFGSAVEAAMRSAVPVSEIRPTGAPWSGWLWWLGGGLVASLAAYAALVALVIPAHNGLIHDRFAVAKLFGDAPRTPENLSDNATVLESYLAEYPDGAFAGIARERLPRAKREAAARIRRSMVEKEGLVDFWVVDQYLDLLDELETKYGDTTYAGDRSLLKRGSGDVSVLRTAPPPEGANDR